MQYDLSTNNASRHWVVHLWKFIFAGAGTLHRNLDAALKTAKAIYRPGCWERLAQQALKQYWSTGKHNQSACPRTIAFDPTGYHFKLALLRNNYNEIPHIIRTSTLLGKSIIACQRASRRIADTQGDPIPHFHNAFCDGDVLGRIAVLRASRMVWRKKQLLVCCHSYIQPQLAIMTGTVIIEHVAAGSLDTAMQRNTEETSPERVLPVAIRALSSIRTEGAYSRPNSLVIGATTLLLHILVFVIFPV
ncbi:hypothetical protein EDB19DRAFT_2029175 [Suillus lakei]|nr:hypothetical protein EDB19DRAFT_2029175 [Suillus lakei]